MGYFSYDCLLCGASMHASDGPDDPEAWREDVLLFAANRTTAEGAYDGAGGIGEFQIPPEWLHDDIAFWTLMIQRNEELERSRREHDALMAHADALILKYSGEVMPREPRPPEVPSEVDDHAQLARSLVENIRFSVYHRRCWEAAGRPGFAGQSKWSEDQGLTW